MKSTHQNNSKYIKKLIFYKNKKNKFIENTVQTTTTFPNAHSTVKKKIEREQERRKENATGTPFNFNPTTQNEKKKNSFKGV